MELKNLPIKKALKICAENGIIPIIINNDGEDIPYVINKNINTIKLIVKNGIVIETTL